MKRSCIAAIVFFLLIYRPVEAQIIVNNPNSKIIGSMPLSLSTNMTTNLIFPYSIQSVDRGSRDILAQKAKGTENILQVKAAREGFTKTNLSVVTEDGKLYSFLVDWSEKAPWLNIELDRDWGNKEDKRLPSPVAFLQSKSNIAMLEATATGIAALKNDPRGIRDKNYGMRFYLKRLFIDEDVIYYKLKLQNRTPISYNIDRLQFFIRDKRVSKRTAFQELEQVPLLVYGNTGIVKGQTSRTIVIALPKFTIPDKKVLYIQVMEKDGGRHLQLKVSNKRIIRASPVSNL